MEEGRDHFTGEDAGSEPNMSVESDIPGEEPYQNININEEDLEEEEILILSSIHFKYNEEEYKKDNVIN